MKGWILVGILVLAAGSLLPTIAQAKEVVTTEVTRQGTYKQNTAEATGVAQWLEDVGAYIKGSLGDITITRTQMLEGGDVQPYVPGDSPPVPLPPNGSPGEVISIGSSNGGWTQDWTYRWSGSSSGGHWMLIRYEFYETLPR